LTTSTLLACAGLGLSLSEIGICERGMAAELPTVPLADALALLLALDQQP
jgi:hypothetical protein